MTETKPKVDEDCVGFNLFTQKLHCILAMNDRMGEALSKKAGEAFFRAFIVEDRATGEVIANQRFRYTDGDSWMRMTTKDKHDLDTKEKVEYLADAIEGVMRLSLETLSRIKTPKEFVVRYYPPNPDDSQATLDWLIAQDLVQITKFYREDGTEVPVAKGTETPT